LFAVGRTPTVLNVLRKHGYTKQVHRRGHTLVEAASVRELDESAIDQEVDDALRTLDEWDDLNVGKIHAALTLFPDFRDEILEGVALGDSRAAVSNVEKILARIAEAEAASDRGKAVAARLAEIRVDASERRRLAGLVRIARGSKIFDRDVVEDDPAERALLELRDWYYEWSELARQLVTRREHLIRLGLAERRAGDPGEDLKPNVDVVVDPTPFNPQTDRPNVDVVVDPTPFIDPNKDKT